MLSVGLVVFCVDKKTGVINHLAELVFNRWCHSDGCGYSQQKHMGYVIVTNDGEIFEYLDEE